MSEASVARWVSEHAQLSLVKTGGASLGDELEPVSGAAGIAEDLDESFVALYRSTYPRLVRALELSGSSRARAEDLAQEAFARTLVHWWRVRRGTNPAGYIYRAAFRLARREPARCEDPLGDPPIPDVASEVATRIDIMRALDAMPPARRRCAVLCLVVGLSPKEAARTLRIAESTVRKQLERARGDLRTGVVDA